jgi:hypothetical protein
MKPRFESVKSRFVVHTNRFHLARETLDAPY